MTAGEIPTRPGSSVAVLQITDVHLTRPQERLLGMDSQSSLEAVLSQALAESRPDVLLVTGDVAQHPEPAVYARFRQTLGSHFQGPRLVLPGNHDVARHMGELLEPSAISIGGWDLVALDSHQDDEPAALVTDADRDALSRACASAGQRHVLVATHHPPLVLDCPWLDKDRIQNGTELLDSLSGHGNVRAMVFGHAHQVVDARHGDIILLGTPSTCIQFAPRTRTFTLDTQRPGYRWLTLHADGTIESRVGRLTVDDFAPDASRFAAH